MFAKLFLKLIGWKVQKELPKEVNRCVMIAAPHTSNWDFFIARAAFSVLGIPVRFTIKDDLYVFPFNIIFNALGGIPINRRPKKLGEKRPSTVDAMANLYKHQEHLAIMITPEGTRSKRKEWKTGFYFVAKKADVPIGLGFLDYKKKLAGVGKLIYPSKNMESDMREIMSFYKNIHPKYPEKFSIDTRYA